MGISKSEVVHLVLNQDGTEVEEDVLEYFSQEPLIMLTNSQEWCDPAMPPAPAPAVEPSPDPSVVVLDIGPVVPQSNPSVVVLETGPVIPQLGPLGVSQSRDRLCSSATTRPIRSQT